MTDRLNIPAGLFSLDGRSAVVTGGSRGIGAAVAKGLADYGATVIRLGRSASPEEPDAERMRYVSCDICDVEAVKDVCRELTQETGNVDILVNAAGVSFPADPEQDELERFSRTVKINLEAAYGACLAASEHMRQAGRGSIVNVTSINSTLGFPGNPGYVASKGGLLSMTRAMAVDLGPSGIRVNALAPGYVHTQMTDASYNDPERHEQRLSQMILPRWGQPQDMVGGVVFLASDASSYMTGQELIIDGGWTAKGLSG